MPGASDVCQAWRHVKYNRLIHLSACVDLSTFLFAGEQIAGKIQVSHVYPQVQTHFVTEVWSTCYRPTHDNCILFTGAVYFANIALFSNA